MIKAQPPVMCFSVIGGLISFWARVDSRFSIEARDVSLLTIIFLVTEI